MATQLAITVTFSVLFLFTLANGRVPSDQPGNDVTTLEGLSSFHEPNPKATNTILFPSEKPDTEPATVVDLEPETTEPNQPEPETISSPETESAEFEESTESRTTSPLTMISLRPIKRHYFPRRLPFRHHRDGCNHHLRRVFKPSGPRIRPEFSYEEEMFPGRGGPRYWVVRDEELGSWRDEDGLKMFHPHDHFRRFHLRHHHNHDEDREELEEKEERRHEREEEKKDGGIFKGVRKFLDGF